MERTQTLQFLAPKLSQLAQSHLEKTMNGGFVRVIVVCDPAKVIL
jgi:hypothetical protein